MILNRPYPRQPINNVYELPSTEQKIKYLHAYDGLPTKAIWFKAVKLGNYNKWPGLKIIATNKFSQNQRKPRKDICDRQKKK